MVIATKTIPHKETISMAMATKTAIFKEAINMEIDTKTIEMNMNADMIINLAKSPENLLIQSAHYGLGNDAIAG